MLDRRSVLKLSAGAALSAAFPFAGLAMGALEGGGIGVRTFGAREL